MPVVVTGASGFLGRHAVRAFARISPEVRAYVRRREAAEDLRGLGAKVAVGWIGDVDNLAAVMDGAHTVCHLVGGLYLSTALEYDEANAASTRTVVAAAASAGVRRVLFVSYPGASPDSPNDFLRSKGEAERVVAGSGLEHVIVRAAHVVGPGSPWLSIVGEGAGRRPARVIGTGRQVVAPVYVDDVSDVLATADDRQRVDSGVWALEGPDRVAMDDLVDIIGGASLIPRGTRHRLSPTAVEVLAADCVTDGPDAAEAFGVVRTSLRAALARSASPTPP